ncbi:sugar phosphate isomerase/epimerase [Aurantibacter crassamenti]|uniref:sugar phosphate isomerase/epimerase family protein n=1 Tax=Aurantibacter crassamenti TaxID=1837375 RepID=UPI00193931FD|nr:sugar phosphate isomerase/epimerase [Aurantibacter crassamenti]MBM1107929.1 sugar phosphate isomerase/epimerase [Aurantibacter crassamenti]
MKDLKNGQSRRTFITKTAAIATGVVLGGPKLFGAPSIITSYNKPNSKFKGVQLGCITYSFRDMADQSAEATLQYVLDSGISAIELMGGPAESFAGIPSNPVDMRKMRTLNRLKKSGDEISEDQLKEIADLNAQFESYTKQITDWRANAPFEKFEKFKKMYADKGVSIYAFKPNAFGKDSSDIDINYGFKAAKALGASHVTLELPGDDAHTLKLGSMAAKHNMLVGYHGHTQQTPTWWDTALKQSPANMMNIDIGHYVAAGNTDALNIIKSKNKRISSMHIKDRKNLINGQENQVFGEGDTPIVEIMQLMRDNKYSFPGTIELEYKIPEGSTSVKEVARCVAYCKKALEA